MILEHNKMSNENATIMSNDTSLMVEYDDDYEYEYEYYYDEYDYDYEIDFEKLESPSAEDRNYDASLKNGEGIFTNLN